MELQYAIFAGGCFWCTEAVFKNLIGVKQVTPGYIGGTPETATYEMVSSGTTEHVEAIRIMFDPTQITYRDLLHVFFYTHNPTTLNKQGADTGTQYRSAIYYASLEQKECITQVMDELQREGIFDNPIVTEVHALDAFEFFDAEQYHHDYFESNPQKPYCQIVIFPKIQKLRAKFSHLLSDDRGI